ncbi:hypothetical protein O77CONTIG1_02779 [Leptolyngbya sp. O-77]|nr:hypothetical protein O77CONTIG1_02779 [Leptolyngbya sp. O-77]
MRPTGWAGHLDGHGAYSPKIYEYDSFTFFISFTIIHHLKFSIGDWGVWILDWEVDRPKSKIQNPKSPLSVLTHSR